MNPGPANRFSRLQRLGLAARLAILVSAVALTYAVVAPVGWSFSGSDGLWASAAAAAVCLAGAVFALVISYVLRDPSLALYGMLFGMLLRMGIPMAFALVINFRGGGLAESGVLYYLVAFYPVTLGIETVLSLPPTESPASCHKTFQDVS